MDDIDSGRALPAATASESQCNACHRTLASPGYVTCHPCRERRAETKRRSNEQRRQARRAALVKPSAEQRKLREERVAEATEWLKKRERTPMKSAGVFPETLAAPSASPVFQKLVNAADLHQDLKTRYPNNRHSLRFYGTYAIIAFPDVDNKQRALQVARDLKDNTTLHFSLKDRKKRRDSDAAKTYTIFYECTCHTSLQRVSAYFDPKNKSLVEDKKSKSECPGRIIISASNDTSHPLGWPGQRVKVTVTHPKA